MTAQDLPAVNAALNGLSTLFLTAGWVFIRNERKLQHAAMMAAAFVTSCLFLVSYITHKVLIGGHTPFAGEGIWRGIYFVVLFSHMLLAMAVVPLAVLSINRALRQRWDNHRRISRFTWPVWMYVSVTGVLVYFMLYRWF